MNELELQLRKQITYLKGQQAENEEEYAKLEINFNQLKKQNENYRIQLNEMTKNCNLLNDEVEKKSEQIMNFKSQIENKNVC